MWRNQRSVRDLCHYRVKTTVAGVLNHARMDGGEFNITEAVQAIALLIEQRRLKASFPHSSASTVQCTESSFLVA